MRKFSLSTAFLLIACAFLPCPEAHPRQQPPPGAYAQDQGDDQESLSEIKARIRREVENEVGAKKAPLPPNPASAKDTVKKTGTKQPSRQTLTKNSIEIPVPFDIDPNIASRLAFIIMFFALVPASIARMKGRSFIAWWVLGTLFFIFVMPIAVFMKNKRQGGPTPAIKAPVKKAAEPAPVKVERTWDKPAKDGSPQAEKEENTKDSAIEVYAKIENLAKLKEKGILTEEEFKAKKNELLSRI